jgi:mono/diheme cytochrome c family protein
LLKQSAADAHPRVRLEAAVASSWVGGETGAEILLEALRHPLDPWMENATLFAMVPLKPAAQALVQAGRVSLSENPVARGLLGRDLRFSGNNTALTKTIDPRVAARLGTEGVELWKIGQDIYSRDGLCSTCHQPDGEGIAKIYPPLARSEWVAGDENRLIKLMLHGLTGPITVRGESYAADLTPPMPALGAMLNDREIAGVLTYVRSTFEPGWGDHARASADAARGDEGAQHVLSNNRTAGGAPVRPGDALRKVRRG